MDLTHPLFRVGATYDIDPKAPGRPHIVCATDFSQAGDVAFGHALRIALAGPSKLTLLHVGRESRAGVRWERFPGVRERLVAWGRLDAAADQADVDDRLGVRVAKFAMRDEDPAAGIIDFAAHHPAHLLVLAHVARGRRRLPGAASVALRVLRAARVPMLILPAAGAGFVDPDSGRSTLRRMLVPVDHEPDARPALALTGSLCAALADEPLEAHAFYVGAQGDAPPYLFGSDPRCSWSWRYGSGDVAEAIAAEPADLVAMPTAGPRGLREHLTGSTLDRLLDRVRCPLLAIPSVDQEAPDG